MGVPEASEFGFNYPFPIRPMHYPQHSLSPILRGTPPTVTEARKMIPMPWISPQSSPLSPALPKPLRPSLGETAGQRPYPAAISITTTMWSVLSMGVALAAGLFSGMGDQERRGPDGGSAALRQ